MTRSPLLSCEAVGKAHGARSLFEELSFGLFEGDQVGLVGPNGAGRRFLFLPEQLEVPVGRLYARWAELEARGDTR